MVDQQGSQSDVPPRWAVPVPGWDGGNSDVAYLDKTLRYGDVETALDESVSVRVLVWMGLNAAVASAIIYLIFLAFAVFVAVAGSESTAAGLMLFGALVSVVSFAVVLLGMRVPEPVAEWRVLLADRADSAASTYSQIAGALRMRRMPIGLEVRPFETGSPRDGVRYRLVLQENFYVTYVSVFAYGTSLYLGWMMWRSRRGGQLIWQFYSDLLAGVLGRISPELRMLRTERPRAMREAVHAACREGLFVAYEQRDVPLEFGFPHPQERSGIPTAPSMAPSPFQPPLVQPPLVQPAPRPSQQAHQSGPSWPGTSHQAATYAPLPQHDPVTADQQAFPPPPFPPPPSQPPSEVPEGGPGWAFERASSWPPSAPAGPDTGNVFGRGNDGDDYRTR
ncbi:hypothetical protein Ga0074812_11777 [Parafrankia irregularis]|uniref:Uncharacterized protein n=1 Tax=Parafrankia irregularis TaxID=795642 RepID=A0A0S4QTK4_9ACTN|nr:hypothetical protein Ga0074812_11777 [Parafrankia irregularis]